MRSEDEYDSAMTFPNGVRVLSRRSTTLTPNGNSLVEEDVKVQGCTTFTWVSGPSWMFEMISIEEGRLSFFRDGRRVEPSSKRFGILYSMFSITETCFDHVKLHWVGFGGTDPFPDAWMNHPMILDLSNREAPTTTAELIGILRAACDFKLIDRVSSPSPLSQSVKSIIDRTYNADLSIAKMARALDVSHPHLTRQFKKDFGLTPIDYCHRLRAMDATMRLGKGERIIDVSLDVGYNDLGRFYKQFRKTMNSSPGSCKTTLKMRKGAG